MATGGPSFEVERWMDWLGARVAAHPRFWIGLGNLENRLLREELDGLAVTAPIYIGGLARSGSTVLLETLARHGATATHQYRDFPPVLTPLLWNRFLDRVPRQRSAPVERSHADGIMVTPESPEALEEVVWMAFFPRLHDPGQSSVLDAATGHPAFERFYRDHIRKLLYLRGGSRYLAKGNYNVTRFEYLLKLFPDARFVLPVRAPENHIASLMKQHALFCDGQRQHPRALNYLRRVGHFEFGLDRRPIHTGDADTVATVRSAWEAGDEVMGWAVYWRYVHEYLAQRLAVEPALREAVMVVRFEDLCDAPEETLAALFGHCRLEDADDLAARAAQTIRAPTYYRLPFNRVERAIIHRETATTAARFGYDDLPHREVATNGHTR